MTDTAQISRALPVRTRLAIPVALTVLVALGVTAAAATGMVGGAAVYGEDAATFVANDFANLVVGIPLLLLSLALVGMGRAWGLLTWPASLLFVTYNYFVYAAAAPFGPLFLAHVTIVATATATAVFVVGTIDAGALGGRVSTAAPALAAGIILLGLGAFVAARQAAEALRASDPPPAERALWMADFIFACPLLFAAGVLVVRRRAFGYVLAGTMLLLYGSLSLGVIPVLLYQSAASGADLDVTSIVAVGAMAVVTLLPFAFFARGAT